MALKPREVLPDEPFADATRRQRPPAQVPALFTPACYALMGLAGAVFVAQIVDPRLTMLLSLYGPRVKDGEWWRIVTWAFVHGGPLHLLFNLSAVWTLGRSVEHLLGTARFLLLSAVGTLGAAAAVLVFNFGAETVGLSGTILSWMGALLPLLVPSARRQALIWLAQVVALSLLPGVSWAGHLGGFLFGLPVGLALRWAPARFAQVVPLAAFVAGVACVLAAGKGA